MQASLITPLTVHQVTNLPPEYTSSPFTYDDVSRKWVIDIAHPQYGHVSAYEDGVVVELGTGRNTILVAYTMEGFNNHFMTFEEQEAEFNNHAVR